MSEQEYWVIKTPQGHIAGKYMEYSLDNTWRAFMVDPHITGTRLLDAIKDYENAGYRAVKVKIVEVEA